MLTPEQITQYRKKGYLVLESFFRDQKLADQKALLDELTAKGRSLPGSDEHFSFEYDANREEIPGMLHKVQGVCVIEPRVLDIAGDSRLLDTVQLLVGPNIDVFGTKFFPKLPKLGTSTSWHQDNHYFGTNSDRIVSCGVYFEDTDRDNGCLRVVPGSHRNRILVEHEKAPNRHGQWTQVDESDATDVICPAGTVVLFSANLLHGARDNHSDRTRYSTAWHYLPGDMNLEKFSRGGYEDRITVRGV